MLRFKRSLGIDYTRVYIPYWQKWERMLRFAREHDVMIPVIQDIYPPPGPTAGGERRRTSIPSVHGRPLGGVLKHHL